MASELLKNRALIQKLKEPDIPRVNFSLDEVEVETLLPEEKPEELFEERERVRTKRLSDTLTKIGGGLMDESVDFIKRENFQDGRIAQGERIKGKLKIPLTSKQKEILEDVYGVKTFEAAKKKYGADTAQLIVQRIRSGQVYKGMKSPIVKGFGPGASIPVEQSPAAKKIIVAELNKLKVMKNNRAFFDFKEGDKWYKNLSKRLNDLSREPLNRAIKTIAQEEFPNSYIGKEGRKRYRQEMVVKTFIDSLEVNKGFTGNEKFLPVLEEFRGTGMHVFEKINKDFKAWANKEFEVEGVDRSKLTAQQLEDIDNYKPNQKQIRSAVKEQQLKWMHGANDRFKNLSASEVEKKFFRKFPNASKNAFLQRANELVQIKRTGSVISGADSTIEYPWAKTEPDNRSRWLKESYGKQFGGNYEALIRRADEFRKAGNIEDAVRLEKAADKYFSPKGIFRKATGEGEHPFSRIMGGADQELKINSLVRGDLNQFKRINFDVPVIQLLNKYSKTEPNSVARQKIIKEIEDRKKLMNLLTETKNEKGIVDVVKFNYGKTKIGPSTQVVPIDKLDEMGKFNLQDFVVRGKNYLQGFEAASKKAPVLMQDGKITTKKFKGKELQDLIAAIACPGKAMGGRVGFQDGATCFEQGRRMINTGNIPKGAGERNFIKFFNTASSIAKKTGQGLRLFTKFAIIPEAAILGIESAVRMSRGDTLSEALKESISYIPGLGGKAEEADLSRVSRYLGKDDAKYIGNLRNFQKAQQELKNVIGAQEADLALTGTEFDEMSSGESQTDVVERYKPKIAEKEKALQEASISKPEELFALSREDEFADIKNLKRGLTGKQKRQELNVIDPEDPLSEDLITPEITQEELNKRIVEQQPTVAEEIFGGMAKATKTSPQQVLDFMRSQEITEEPVDAAIEKVRREQFEKAYRDSALREALLGFNIPEPVDLEEYEPSDRFEDFKMNEGIYSLKDELDEID